MSSITFLEDYFPEGGSGGILVAFTDTTGSAVPPNAGLTWSLFDADGNVVNSREDVAIDPAESVTIVLSGDDLALASGETGGVYRYLLIKGTYNSSTLGNNALLRLQCAFPIADYVGVT
jgi:hypothetical protein